MKYAPKDKEYYQKRIEEGSEGIDYSIQRIDLQEEFEFSDFLEIVGKLA